MKKNVGKALFWWWVGNIVVAVVWLFFSQGEADIERLLRNITDGVAYGGFYIWLNVLWQWRHLTQRAADGWGVWLTVKSFYRWVFLIEGYAAIHPPLTQTVMSRAKLWKKGQTDPTNRKVFHENTLSVFYSQLNKYELRK